MKRRARNKKSGAEGKVYASPHGFVDLLPVDDAEIKGNYEDALKFALEHPRINNIAITGP